MSSNKHPDMPENIDEVIRQTAFTFDEDRVVIEAQYKNILEFGEQATWTDIHVDVGANRARRIVSRLLEQQHVERMAEA
jgi:vanillate O-demethylase monooxygenase subunit